MKLKITGPLRLRSLFACIMAGYVLVTFLIGYGGIAVYDVLQVLHIKSSLNPVALSGVQKLEKHQIPNESEMIELNKINAKIAEDYDFKYNIVLGLLSAMAMAGAAAIAIYLSRQIAAPIETVADAARRVRAGDFTVRAVSKYKGAGETAQLVSDFNQMVQALSDYDREYKENAAAIAHELRTPLTILRGRLQGMQDGLFPCEPQLISNLIHQVDALGRVVEDLRTVSLSFTGKLLVHRYKIDLASEIAILLETVSAALENDEIVMEVNLKPAVIIGDAERIRQACLALIENVRQHARSGKHISIDTYQLNGFSYIVVKDRGLGLTEEAINMAFKRFWRADSSRSRAFGGSGLGLSVVEAIVVAHEGAVTACNSSEGGAEFRISIPCA